MCLICLLSQREYKPIWEDIDKVRREDIVTFEQYATEYWAKHSQYNEREGFPCEDTIQLTQEFLHNKLEVLKNWKQNFWELEVDSWNQFSFVECSNLYIAACYGLKICMQRVLINDYKLNSDINIQGGFYGSVIQAAAAKGYKEIVELSLQHSANVNLQCGNFGTAIIAAASGGHEGIVEYLVQHGAEVNLQGGNFRTAIAEAASGGHQDIVEYLVQHGADINLQDINLQGGKYGTAVAAAASEGYQNIVEYLLQHGAVLNLQGGD
ncbi:ankyrin repeat-containing domain protein [Lentinula raphanica]|uniref:Ankyrin repeat-containing domain protein n=1 Tax=Lentinula raphanica TaxID=153919 RepID=A0AA38PAW1_9AGAR|nr:ankyrin repeat-containing domain protein [Lentinula raphanica]